MKDAQKPDHVSLNTLIGRLKEGRYVIPDFQREFEWLPWDIRELMRSIFLDYYIGNLLLWKGKRENFDSLSCEPIYGFGSGGAQEYIVLDGQQRLTAMYYAFFAPDVSAPNRSNRFIYYIDVAKFMAEVYDEAFNYDWARNRVAKVLNDRTYQYQHHIFPLTVVGAGGWDLYEWIQGYQEYWQAKKTDADAEGDTTAAEAAERHSHNVVEFGEHVKGITEQYQISYIELDRDLEVAKVCDIFTQINSRGVRLDIFDLINALLKPKGLQLKHMWREAAPKLEFVETEKMNVYILQVMSILRQAYCSPKYLYYLMPGQERSVRAPDGKRSKEILVSSVEDFKERWAAAVAAIESAIRLLRHPQEYGAVSSQYLPYVSILPAFSALLAAREDLEPESKLDARLKIRHWYWASVFTNRYSGSVESTSARDFLDITAWIENDAAEPLVVQEFKSQFRNIELRKELRRGSSVYNGVFNLLVLRGAQDWMTGDVPQHGDLDDHHIVPASWGFEHLGGQSIHTILNRTPLTADTNRNVIRDRLPNEYLPELIERNGEGTVRSILESHFVSPTAQEILLREPFSPYDFEAFIAERQRTIQDAMENLLIKERLDLSPQLRELDARVEKVELGLRATIVAGLADDIDLLPSHIAQSIDERIRTALKRSPSMEAEYYDTVAGKLEYADLRELEGTVVNKSLWNRFQDSFGTKESLASKFGQLAELRNGIRHTRSVDEITRKEGEAALLWFEQALKL